MDRQLANYSKDHEIERQPTMHMQCKILATLLEFLGVVGGTRGKSTGESFCLGSISGQQTLKLLALTLRDTKKRAAPAPK